MKVVFAGGGTGGHLYPAIALADALQGRAECEFVGTADRLERTIVPRAGYRLHVVAASPLARRGWAILRTVAVNALGTLQALTLLRRLRPDLVVAAGGYVCFPVVVAARLLRGVRLYRGSIALLEPNARPGLTNRLLAPVVDEIWSAFDAGTTYRRAKVVRVGVPVRMALRHLPDREAACARLGLDPQRRTLVAFGGSQGARRINDALVDLLRSDALPRDWQVLHLTGEGEYERVRAARATAAGALRPYLDDIGDAYAAADLVLSRAGASTLGELAATGRPAILVPYPHATDDHQRANAEAFAATGAGVMVADRELDGTRLATLLESLTQPERLATLRAAAERLRGEDPTGLVLARIDALTARRGGR